MNSYQILNAWEGFCKQNPRLIKPIHHAILLHAITVCNGLYWPDEFQLPTNTACQLIGIVDRETFGKGLRQLIEFGAIREIQPARGLHVARFVSFIDAPLYLPIKPAGRPAGTPADESDAKPEKKKRTHPTVSPFVDSPPSEQEVAEYFIKQDGPVLHSRAFAGQFIAHYSLLKWEYGKSKTPLKDWRAAVRTWDPKTWRPRNEPAAKQNPQVTKPPFLVEDR